MSVVEVADAPEEPDVLSRPKRKNESDGISSSPKRQKISDTYSSTNNDDSAGARAARELNSTTSENLFPESLFELEKDFLSTIGIHEEQARSQEILSKMRAIIEQVTGRSLAEKREEQLEILYSIDGVRERVERIRSASGFKETHQLLKYIDIIQLNMKTAEASPNRKADLDKLTRELRRVIQRIQATQTRMQRLTLKVNLPRNEESFAVGLGEGCFVVVEEQTKALFDVNREGGIYVGILLNSPVYKEWFHLKEGDPVLFCMKGQLRPVAFVDQTSVVDQLRGMFNSDGEHVHPALSASGSTIPRSSSTTSSTPQESSS